MDVYNGRIGSPERKAKDITGPAASMQGSKKTTKRRAGRKDPGRIYR
jgi:hypothetical protein